MTPRSPLPLPPGLRCPGAPPELRSRVLAACRQKPPEAAPTPWWWRRSLRLAWAAVMILLIAAHLALDLSSPHPAPAAAPPQVPAAVSGPAGDPVVAGLAVLEAARPAPSPGGLARQLQLVDCLLDPKGDAPCL